MTVTVMAQRRVRAPSGGSPAGPSVRRHEPWEAHRREVLAVADLLDDDANPAIPVDLLQQVLRGDQSTVAPLPGGVDLLLERAAEDLGDLRPPLQSHGRQDGAIVDVGDELPTRRRLAPDAREIEDLLLRAPVGQRDLDEAIESSRLNEGGVHGIRAMGRRDRHQTGRRARARPAARTARPPAARSPPAPGRPAGGARGRAHPPRRGRPRPSLAPWPPPRSPAGVRRCWVRNFDVRLSSFRW